MDHQISREMGDHRGPKASCPIEPAKNKAADPIEKKNPKDFKPCKRPHFKRKWQMQSAKKKRNNEIYTPQIKNSIFYTLRCQKINQGEEKKPKQNFFIYAAIQGC